MTTDKAGAMVERLRELLALSVQATPGEWHVQMDFVGSRLGASDIVIATNDCDDAALAAAAVNFIREHGPAIAALQSRIAELSERAQHAEDVAASEHIKREAAEARIAELERDAARLGPSDRQAKWELAASLLVELGEPGLASSARGHAIIERMVEEKRCG